MSERRIACPRCAQAWLDRVRLVHLNRDAILCSDCDALWLQVEDLEQLKFVDFATYMIAHGRGEGAEEITVYGPLERPE